jgi:predicted permease
MTIAQDLQYAWRQLRKSPGFALTAILTLALGIGATTAMFSIVNAVLLRPMAYRQPGRLVVIHETVREVADQYPVLPVNLRHAANWAQRSRTLTGITVFQTQAASISKGVDHPRPVGMMLVQPNLFSVMGVQPILGRTFLPQEVRVQTSTPAVILSYALWQSMFSGDPKTLGRTVRVNGTPETVVGIMPPSFRMLPYDKLCELPPQVEIYQPLQVDPEQHSLAGDYNFGAIARLAPGVTLAQARAELNGIQQAFSQQIPQPYHLGATLAAIQEAATHSAGRALYLLLAAVGGVLLIGCVNLANLQLARAVSRERESAIRAALGAGRLRLVQVWMTESALLGLVGGALGLAAAWAGVRFFVRAAPLAVPRMHEVRIDPWVLLFATLLSIGTVMLFGFLPALRAVRFDPQQALQTNPARIASSRSGSELRTLLVAGEAACTTVLLIVSGLALHSFWRVLNTSRGFDAARVVVAETYLRSPQYGDQNPSAGTAHRAAFYDEALDRLGRLPGVQAAALTSATPLGGATWIDEVRRPGQPSGFAQAPTANYRWISPGYLKAMGIGLIAGRPLEPQDKNHPQSALISATTARTVWPGENPVGRTFQRGSGQDLTVVGVVADARITNLKQSPPPVVYLPYWNQPPFNAAFLVRVDRAPAAIISAVRQAIWSVDPNIAIPKVESFTARIDDSLLSERFTMLLLAAFAAAALALAALGIYGVLSYSVSMRTQEIGVRIALGARPNSLYRLVLAQAMRPVVFGTAAGVLAGVLAARAITSLLYEVPPLDPLALACAVSILLAAAAAAALLPARRAASVNPVEALRAE